MKKEYAVAVVVGRHQISHVGHELLKRKALEIADLVIIILGSAFHARDPRNPFKWTERQDMILSTLSEEEKSRVICAPVRDYYDNDLWNAEVKRIVHEHECADQRIALVGHKKKGDKSTYYLDNFKEWELVEVESNIAVDASELRAVYFEAENMDVSLSAISDYVLPPVRQYLKAWSLRREYGELVEAYKKIKADHEPYKNLRWDVTLTTVDAIVRIDNHILLGKRRFHPGKDLWALPGGFVEKTEHFLDAALRELTEETQIGLMRDTLLLGLKGEKVLSWPTRSCRIERTVSHAFFFDLPGKRHPFVKGADDMYDAAWIHEDKLKDLEESIFEDHYPAINYFLGKPVGS